MVCTAPTPLLADVQAAALIDEAKAAHAAGALQRAEHCVRAALAAGPTKALPHALCTLAALCADDGRLEEAENAYASALPLMLPRAQWTVETQLALAHCLLAQGKYGCRAWGLYEARHESVSFSRKPTFPAMRAREWRGEDIRGKHLVILPEQGLGDEIQFARFAPWLQERTGASVTLVCDYRLAGLFKGLGVRVRTTDEFVVDTHTQRTADVWVMNMSIPDRVGLQWPDLPAEAYLSAQPRRRQGARIGIVTKGNPQHGNDHHRSLPPQWAEALLALSRAVSLHPADTGALDFMPTAETIAGLDLVVTVDTSVAHLAGALGKPVWILLPAHRTDWRWMRGTATSPWYPTARLYRQPTVGDWATVLEEVQRALP